ncbi:hypothetical protein [Paenibacillus contaminans]|jgi:hypothetical protein|nr:hypothetical protein [Paenibacillus contaminans]
MEKKANNKNGSPDFRENKFVQEQTQLQPEKAADYVPSLNQVSKQGNPQ